MFCTPDINLYVLYYVIVMAYYHRHGCGGHVGNTSQCVALYSRTVGLQPRSAAFCNNLVHFSQFVEILIIFNVN